MSRVAAVVARTFSSVQTSRNFRLFFVGQLISVTGGWVNATASSVLVLRLSDSGVALGTNMALLFLPVLLLGPFAGVLADRHDKRRLILGAQVGYMVVALGLYGLIVADAVELWMVYALSFAAGIATAIENPARQSFYVELVGEAHLTNAVSLNSAVFTGTRVVGSALAGYLIHAFGLATCYLIDGVTYLAVIWALLAMREDELHPGQRAVREAGQVREGLRIVWATAALRRPLLLMAAIYALSFTFSVSVPLMAFRTFPGDERTLGWLFALLGVGSLVGALAMAHRNTRPTFRMLAWAALGFGVTLLAAGVAPTLGAAYAAMVPLGLAGLAFAIIANTTLQHAARPDMRGRVMALYGALFLGSTPVGSFVAGFVGEHVGSRAPFVVGGAVALVAGLVSLWAGERRTRSAG
jgi:MFS family permease